MIGISASEKSTWAKDFVSKNDNWCIVSRDDFRYAWQNKGVVDQKLEVVITEMVTLSIEHLIMSGYSVIYDATNLKAKYLKSIIAGVVGHVSKISYQIFDVHEEVAIARDLLRERSVGANVIEQQYKDYVALINNYDFQYLIKSDIAWT